MKRFLSAITVIAIAVAIFATLTDKPAQAPKITGNLLTVTSSNGLPSRLIHYKGMDVSFNPEAHVPNWVAWELTGEEARGEEPRYNKFMQDTHVEGCATPSDYKFSGYDRGHMAPAADMKWDKTAMQQSFLLTNVAPQDHRLNSGSWKKLEEKCRLWATLDSAIYIVCGPVLTDEITERIGTTGVAVPQRFFKVIISPYANPPRGIGFIMPNGRVEGGIQKAACSIDEVEAITGLDFFPALPDSLENIIESQNDFNKWNKIQ